ncbi:MAG: AAA family ATPase, partial [Herminiimonas sp.]|nr:AAA family ATPase [Herminiimonas sp.]
MRLTRLDLLKFGKFSDRSLAFPQASHDFHLVVGPNEAGKSTLRNAILDLFYGIGKTSAFNFMHAYGDMKLGALIEHDGKSLDFARTKGNKRTLTHSSGDVLADDALVPFLGATDRSFFDQMFGLDHDKLVRGGNDILNASNDIGQILFQSATGIGSLGDVRKTLEAEANLLWAPKKSSEREYYIARDELEKADAQLKQLTVRTKEWLEYSTTVERLGGDFATARARYAKLDQHRNQLERMRRVATALAVLRQKQADLQLLGAVTALPANATSMMANAELELATATEAQQLHDTQASALRAQFDLLDVKAGLLLRADDIQALAEMRQQVRAHEPDILKRQHEVDLLWQTARSLARELGWPAQAEAALQARVPPALTRTAIAALIKKRAAVEQARSAADDALNGRLGEARALDAQASERVPMTVSPAVRAALDRARNLGDTAAAELLLRERLRRASAELAAAQAGLGNWPLTVDFLRTMQAPSVDQIDHFLAQQNRAATDRAYLAERLDDQQAAVRQVELDIVQFQTLHQPVTREQVADLRRERDTLWDAIKQGQRAPVNTATEYEAKVAIADKMADLRHDGAQQATELQA